MRRHEGPWLEGVLDDRQRTAALRTLDLEDHPDTRGKDTDPAGAGPDRLDPRRDADLVDGLSVEPAARRALRAAAGHLVGLMTWRSLVVEQGLREDEAVELAVTLLCAAASPDVVSRSS